MSDSIGFALFVVAVLVVLGWYAVGTQYNVRLGNRALQWLQQGLPVIGEKTTLRWLGSSVVELKLAKPRDPFRAVDLMIVMEPRDIPPFWLLGHLEGRRDLVIIRAHLNNAPRFELEARGDKTWGTASAKRDPKGTWTELTGGLPNGVRAEYRGDISAERAREMLGKALAPDVHLTRLSIARGVPNLEMHLLLPPLNQSSAPRLFTRLRDLSQNLTA